MQNDEAEIIFRKADDFVQSVYKITAGFPKSESFGLVSDLRRTVVFLPLYLQERSSGNFTRANNCKILERAHSALKATEFLLSSANQGGYVEKQELDQLINSAEEVAQMICQQIQELKKETDR